ncbi:MAG: hypothetical protein ACXVPB_07605 [Bacteroidia bacterium]
MITKIKPLLQVLRIKLSLFLLSVTVTGIAQNMAPSKHELEFLKANEFYDINNYVQALDGYLRVEKIFPKEIELKHRIGVCYLNIHDDKAKALPYLLEVHKAGIYKDELLLELGMAYQYAYQFENAIKFYTQYRERSSQKKWPLIDHYIETCENGKELIKKPIDVKFENLGKEVNSKYPDYYPFVSKDEGALYFTSRREDCIGSQRSALGYYSSDVYVSRVEKGEWQKAKNVGVPINTAYDEEIVGLSQDGKKMVVYVDRKDQPSDLMQTEIQKTKNFGRPVAFNPPINTDGVELEGGYTNDGNTFYFTAVRKGGMGDADVYVTNKLPNGEWGIPQNLGPNINTIYKEGFPVISEDKQYLYFASQGHTNMGGFDIFKSKWNENKKEWGPAENIGYPVNTTDDDMMYSLAGQGRDGYLSAWRKEGYGDLDVYKVTFLSVEERLTALVGNVRSADTTIKTIEATASIFDSKTGKEIDSKEVNRKTGRYIFIVEPGKYYIEIKGSGFKPLKEEVTVYGKCDFTSELEKTFTLVPVR